MIFLAGGFVATLYRVNYVHAQPPLAWDTLNAMAAGWCFAAVVCGSVAMYRQGAVWFLVVLPAAWLGVSGYLGDF